MSYRIRTIIWLSISAFATLLEQVFSPESLLAELILHATQVVGLVGAYLMIHLGLKSLEECKTVLVSFSKGDLRATVANADAQGNEVQQLALEVNKVGISLAEVVGELRGAESSLRSAVGSFENTQSKVSQGAQQILQLSGVVTENAKDTAKSIEAVNHSTHSMSEAVIAVSAAMEEMVATSSEIERRCEEENRVVQKSQAEAAQADSAMKDLQDLVSKIGAITQVIEDIASQTNLLALNATIEAAGAGEAGKGFTVVANEVKQLSRQTAQATGDIRGQVEQIQRVAQNVSQRISQVAKIIIEIQSSSSGTLNAVQEQRNAIQDVSRNLADASQSAGVITNSFQQVSNAAHQTAQSIATVYTEADSAGTQIQKSAEDASLIVKTTQRLAAIVGFFKSKALQFRLTPDLYTHVGNVDPQHQRLFDLINELSQGVADGKGPDALAKVCDGLLEYTKIHFREEEDMLEKIHYAELEPHKALHRKFEARVKQARDDIASGKGMVASEVIRFLADWLSTHIAKVDQRYVSSAKKGGF